MALVVYTASPRTLLEAIYQAIDNGKIVTWEYDSDRDLTHKPDQWKNKAWFRPNTSSGVLQFGLLGQKNVVMTKSVYGIYHGRFIEELLSHFDGEFSTVTATAQQDSAIDKFKTASLQTS